jgi:GGDEF domain-containing protein
MKKSPARAAASARHPRKPSHLQVYKELLEPRYADAARLFEAGLRLLVQRLEVDSAVMVRLADLGLESIWWATRDEVPPGPAVLEPQRGFCPLVLEEPGRTLVIRDAGADPHYRDHPGHAELGLEAYIGVPLRRSDATVGVLAVQHGRPRTFTRTEVTLANLVANVLSKSMEIELLKQELHTAREALDLTMSVVEDSALEAPETRLPSRSFLEVWLRAYLFMARRRSECMAVAVWNYPVDPESSQKLRSIADHIRGGDLLVDLGRESFALLMPRTAPEGAEVVLARVRQLLGGIAMGGTIWHPVNPADQDDLTIRNAMRRAMEALRRSRERNPPLLDQAVWVIPKAAAGTGLQAGRQPRPGQA